MKRVAHALVFGSMAAALLCTHTLASAQLISLKPGLWVQASQVTIDGQSMGDLFFGSMDDKAASTIKTSMKHLGLPAGWMPEVQCQTAETLGLQALVQRSVTPECPNPTVAVKGNVISFKAPCAGQMPPETAGGAALAITGSMDGELLLVSASETRSTQKAVMTWPGGKTQVSELQTVGKWIGANCKKPPAHIKPEWLQSLVR